MLWIALVSIHNACNCVTIDCKAATIDYLNAHGTNLRKAKMSLVEHARQLHKILASTAYHHIMQSKLRGASIGSSIGTSCSIPWEDVQQGWFFSNLSIKLIKPIGKFKGKTPDALHTAPSQRTQTIDSHHKQNTKHNNDNDNTSQQMPCSYNKFLCSITHCSCTARPSHERLGRPMLGPLTDWHSSHSSVQSVSQIRKHVFFHIFPSE